MQEVELWHLVAIAQARPTAEMASGCTADEVGEASGYTAELEMVGFGIVGGMVAGMAVEGKLEDGRRCKLDCTVHVVGLVPDCKQVGVAGMHSCVALYTDAVGMQIVVVGSLILQVSP